MTYAEAMGGRVRRRGARWASAAGERGSATVWLLAAGLLTVLVGGGLAGAGAVVVARHRAQAAADLGALAGAAYGLDGPAAACRRAELIVRANGARMLRCELRGLDVVVTAQVRARGLGGNARATARAGPVEPAPGVGSGRAPTDHRRAGPLGVAMVRPGWQWQDAREERRRSGGFVRPRRLDAGRNEGRPGGALAGDPDGRAPHGGGDRW